MNSHSVEEMAEHRLLWKHAYTRPYQFPDQPDFSDLDKAIDSDGLYKCKDRIIEPNLNKSELTSRQRNILSKLLVYGLCGGRYGEVDILGAIQVAQALQIEIKNGRRSPITDFERGIYDLLMMAHCFGYMIAGISVGMIFISILCSITMEKNNDDMDMIINYISIPIIIILSDFVWSWMIPFYKMQILRFFRKGEFQN